MKSKYVLAGMALAAMASLSACSSKDTITTDTSVLPDAAVSAIKGAYADASVSQIKVDREALGNDDYEVMLSNGTKIEFDNAGNVTEVSAAMNDSVPDKFIPAAIKAYSAEKYAGQKIVKIEIGKQKTEVKLSSGMELEFNPQGQFIKIDD